MTKLFSVTAKNGSMFERYLKKALKLLRNLLVVSAVMASSTAMAKKQGTLEQCQYIKQRIEHFTELRRSGGSFRAMENWKKHRNRHKDEYADLRCTKWRNKLR